MIPILIPITIVGLAFLFPLAVYCLVLGMVNRRPHPVMIQGQWDFAGVLFALSGFLLVGGPCILTGFNHQWRQLWVYGRIQAVHELSTTSWLFWTLVWVGYFCVVVGGSLHLLRRRRGVTAVYNVSPPVFDEMLTRVFDRLGLRWTRCDNRISLETRAGAATHPPGRSVEAAGAPHALAQSNTVILDPSHPGAILGPPAAGEPVAHPFSSRPVSLVLQPFPAAHHVTLSWSDDAGSLRHEIEAELERVMVDIWTTDNPSSAWLLTIAACLFSMMFFIFVSLAVVFYMHVTRF